MAMRITLCIGLIMTIAGLLIFMSANTQLREENQRARGIREGQCAMMWWYVATDELKNPTTTRNVYPQMCKGEQPLSHD